jgi:putative heme-binding domain-containing protein
MNHRIQCLFLAGACAMIAPLTLAHPIAAAEPSFGDAQWIWVPPITSTRNIVGSGGGFVKKFTVTGEVDKAVLRIASDFSTLHVVRPWNPAFGTDNSSYPRELDVTHQIVRGENIFSLVGTSNDGPAAIAARLEIALRDGTVQTIVTDTSWLCNAQNQSLPVVCRGPVAADYWTELAPDAAISAFDNYEQWQQAKRTDQAKATDAAKFQIADGFEIELVKSAGPDEGSWVSIACDPKGRFVIGREDQGLLRLSLPGSEADRTAIQVETVNDTLKECRGLLFAHDSLYAIANESKGMYRLRDADGDDRFEQVTELFQLTGKGGHGRNGLALGPEGRVHLICGDAVDLPTDVKDRTSPFTEHRRGERTKEGFVLAFDADGNNREILCTGLRNPYGIAFNELGDSFTYDADAEFDMGSPWYRPTRVLHLAPGSDFGWRGVTGNWPPYFPDHKDNAPPVLDIGKGSPTAVLFGNKSTFPTRYQKSLFILDWAYGRIVAVDLEPRGASYVGKATTFCKGRPFNVTSLCFGPDGAMYVVTGGRKTQSGLYRIRYIGKPQPEPEPTPQQVARREFSSQLRTTRRRLETQLSNDAPVDFRALDTLLGNEDPRISYAARIVVEHQPVERWPHVAKASLISRRTQSWALAMIRSRDPKFDEQLAMLPLLLFNGSTELKDFGKDPANIDTLLALTDRFPAESRDEFDYHRRLSRVVANAARKAPDELPARLYAAARTNYVVPDLMLHYESTEIQRTRMLYLFLMRDQPQGWTDELRTRYFQHLAEARRWQGGEGMPRFIQRITDDALAAIPEAERAKYAAVVTPEAQTADDSPLVQTRPIVKTWKADDVPAILSASSQARPDLDRGKQMFAAALCNRCHRFGTAGHAVGPDLTGLARRFSRRDMLEHILAPSKVIAEQYRTVQIETRDGQVIVGRILSEGDYRSQQLRIATNPLDPRQVAEVAKSDIESHTTTNTSLMPEGLLNTLNEAEIRDLLAYLETAAVSP